MGAVDPQNLEELTRHGDNNPLVNGTLVPNKETEERQKQDQLKEKPTLKQNCKVRERETDRKRDRNDKNDTKAINGIKAHRPLVRKEGFGILLENDIEQKNGPQRP